MDELRTGDPTSIGQYRLLGRLGTGTLSVVFLATDGSDGGATRYAIKVLRPNIADEERFRRRLNSEVGRIMSVAGRHTARVHEVVEEGRMVYLVTEYVDGDSLEQLVAHGRRIQGPLLWFMAGGLVDALREIHGAGIVHRDLKPSNVLIGSNGVKVTDFAFGGILDEGGFTRPGTLMNSVAWLSPEQITGAPVDTRTDIFNLGLVLAYVALGRHPYSESEPGSDTGEPLGSGRPEAMMYRISHTAPGIESVPSPMREMIARCLSIDPSQRPSLVELGSFFASGGTSPSTQPIPIIRQAEPSIESGAQSATGSNAVIAGVGSRVDATPPAIERPAPVNIVREDLGFRTQADVPLVESDDGVRDEYSGFDGYDDFDDDDDGRNIQPTTRRRRGIIVAGVVAAAVVLIAGIGIVDYTNALDLGLIGATEQTTTTTTSTTTTTTTVAPTTTLPPPPPVYRLYEANGTKYRWNPCQNPIKILLNPKDKLTPGQQGSLEAFLTEQASELSVLTGMTIEYSGLTEEMSGAGYAYGEEILLHIDIPGQGLLEDDKPFEGSISGDRVKDGFREIDAVNFQYNANSLQYLFLEDELHSYGKWLVMLILGNAMGLNPLAEADMTAAGSTNPDGWEQEIMFYGGRHLDTPTWGPGDRQGLIEVGASAGCF